MMWLELLMAFLFGVWLGSALTARSWKRNAKDYKGIDGKKVVTMDFYDHKIFQEYKKYLDCGGKEME
jgi:hypothetical protein